MIVEGRYISIRAMNEDDAESVVAWRNHPAVARRLVQWEPLTVEGHLKFFASALQRGEVFYLCVDANGHAIGTCSFYGFDRHRTMAEWGRLCFDMERKTRLMVRETVYLSHRLGFEQLALKRIHCRCAADNVPAVKVYEEAGYQREGLRRSHLNTPEGTKDVAEFGLFPGELRRDVLEPMLYEDAGVPVINAG